ncbi:MAG TPA: hypothetical protein VGS28_02585 [Candidatus Saccharimonadales bacterium]|nr:hypothetical protein [Candidatus Saccharimonadales bacterium]
MPTKSTPKQATSKASPMTKVNMAKVFILWLPFAVLVTGLSLFTYVAVQSDMRQTANNLPTQYAEDAVTALNNGAPISEVAPTYGINMAKSLDVVVIVTNKSGKVLAASGQLNGTPPVPPTSALNSASASGEDAITWQPDNSVREATVIKPFTTKSQSGYVIAATSLRLVEQNESNLTKMAFVTLFGTLVASFLLVMLPGTRDLIQ